MAEPRRTRCSLCYCMALQVIAEFVNPKYADASKTTFKSSTRLECMMQVGKGRGGGVAASCPAGPGDREPPCVPVETRVDYRLACSPWRARCCCCSVGATRVAPAPPCPQDFPKSLPEGTRVGFTVVNQVRPSAPGSAWIQHAWRRAEWPQRHRAASLHRLGSYPTLAHLACTAVCASTPPPLPLARRSGPPTRRSRTPPLTRPPRRRAATPRTRPPRASWTGT